MAQRPKKGWNKKYFQNILPSLMSRICPHWFLDRETLAEYALNGTIDLENKIYCGIVGNHDFLLKSVKERAKGYNFPLKISDDKTHFTIKINDEKPLYIKYYPEKMKKYICAPNPREKGSFANKRFNRYADICINGIWRFQWDFEGLTVKLPFKTGAWLDRTYPFWYKKHKYIKRTDITEDWILKPKRWNNAIELMRLIHERARESDIGQYIFPGFGTMLGIVREHNFIGHDHDMDHCLLMDKITPAQEAKFFENCRKEFTLNERKYPHGLYEGREKIVDDRNNPPRFVWNSLGHKKINKHEKGVKSCVWGFFEHDRFLWHTKGARWLERFNVADYFHKNTDDAIAKGIRKEYFDDWTTMDFHGVKINIPILAGHCVDEWYPGWMKPCRKSKSSKANVLRIPEWERKKEWVIYEK